MPVISKSRWQDIQAIYDDVLKQPTNKRDAFIEQACLNQPEIKSDILKLLGAEKRSPNILDQAAKDIFSTLYKTEDPSPKEQQTLEITRGATIGQFKLIRELGRGGMGAVYLAERIADFKQTVAIKVLWRSENSKEQLERFKREQELLANLDHPNIAKLYDGGFTDSGQPYLIMEYVDGLDLESWCETQQPELADRLNLINQVASAAGFAHKHLIVHRDLKPSNILVRKDGTVKLLDFGIAKLIDQSDSNNLTQYESSPLTPGYSAPEQLQNKTISVTTDIYQLGLVSYLILSGVSAYTDSNSSLAQLIQQVCNEAPLPPSKASALAPIGSKPTRLTEHLKGDLDAIVLKMLQVLPEDRYSSMDAVIRDLNAFLECKPVNARKASRLYILKRALQRHWKFALLGAGLLLLLLSYTAALSWQRQQTELALLKSQKEQAKAEQVSAFLTKVFNAADPNISGLDEVTAKELLQKGESSIITSLGESPEALNHMLNIFAQIWQRQQHYSHAENILEQARNITQTNSNTNTVEYAKTLSLSGLNYLFTGEYDKALEFSDKGILLHKKLNKSTGLPENNDFAYLLLIKSFVVGSTGNNKESHKLATKAIQILNKQREPNQEHLAFAYIELSANQHLSGHWEAARDSMIKAAEIQKRVTGEKHTDYTTIITNLAVILMDLENLEEAEKYSRQAQSILENIYGKHSSQSSHARLTTASILQKKGSLDEAETILRQASSLNKSSSNTKHSVYFESILQLGSILQDKGEYIQAEAVYQEIIERLDSKLHPTLLAKANSKLASVKYRNGKYQESKSLFLKALSSIGDQGFYLATSQLGLAQTLLKLNESRASLTYAKSALEKREQRFPKNHSRIIEAKLVFAMALAKTQENTDTEKKHRAKSLLENHLNLAINSDAFHFGERLQLIKTASEFTANY